MKLIRVNVYIAGEIRFCLDSRLKHAGMMELTAPLLQYVTCSSMMIVVFVEVFDCLFISAAMLGDR